ncbi:MAG: pantetheine-phosphate adenylyltransferase [Candidatus Omnitrophica bacterium]|nr:pantetheine-phosphate adenylyltransferase [Candidatus Omnitrophota bacterium]MCM8793270.1 pantetheine-phosphate adenylyltransferase [Candidatus Omnitrophota bacterium]
MERIAIYPGTFDPITYGHLDIIKRATILFDKLIIVVVKNPQKETLFSWEERLALVKKAVKGMKGVEVDSFSGLVVDYVKRKKANIIIRGLRMISDFEYEFQMALTNRRLSPSIETIFMMPSEAYSYLSSKLIKEAGSLGAKLSSFIPPFVEKALRRKFAGKGL